MLLLLACLLMLLLLLLWAALNAVRLLQHSLFQRERENLLIVMHFFIQKSTSKVQTVGPWVHLRLNEEKVLKVCNN
jgi:hypothetical protein